MSLHPRQHFLEILWGSTINVGDCPRTSVKCIIYLSNVPSQSRVKTLIAAAKYSLNSMIIFEPFQVIIEGFKSYKEQVATEPFSSKHNCVGKYAHLLTCLSQA